MPRTSIIKFCDKNRIDDGLLREFIHKKLWDVAHSEVDVVINKLQNKINALQELKTIIENKDNHNV